MVIAQYGQIVTSNRLIGQVKLSIYPSLHLKTIYFLTSIIAKIFRVIEFYFRLWIKVAVSVGLVICAAAHGTHSVLMARVDEGLAKTPENGELWYRRAILNYEHQDWAAAAVDFQKAEKFAPAHFPIRLWQGRILDQQGKTIEAKSKLDEFLNQRPLHWEGLATRARILAKMGLKNDSLNDFRAALRQNAQAEPDLVQEVAQSLAVAGCVDEAVAVLESGLKRLGAISSLQMALLDVEVDAERHDSALARAIDYQKAAPRPEPWMQKRASLLAQAGRIDQSRTAWKSLISHLAALPPAERESHAMVLLSKQAQQAILVLNANTIQSNSDLFKRFKL